jgi:hypothetical protein
MKPLRLAAISALAAMAALPCSAESRGSGSVNATAQASPTVISQDPLTRQIMLSLTQPNGGVRSFTATANQKTIELLQPGADPLQPLKPVEGLVKQTLVKVPSKGKTPIKAFPQLKTAADKGRLQ